MIGPGRADRVLGAVQESLLTGEHPLRRLGDGTPPEERGREAAPVTPARAPLRAVEVTPGPEERALFIQIAAH